MEKIIYIIILIILNNDFYNDIKEVTNTSKYDIIVNKKNKLSNNYIPQDLELINITYSLTNKYLRKVAKTAFEKLAKDAKKEKLNIIAISAYRSYEYQERLYNNYILNKGINYADMCSARPGHSEHQTGLAIDVANITLDYDNFENTKEFIWMEKNAYKYGFILRYPKSCFHITGFKYEPWHYRYVGVNIAKVLKEKNITLEEYFKK